MMIRWVAGITVALALAACGGQTKPSAEASSAPMSSPTSSPAPVPTPAPAPAVPAKGDRPTKEFLVGKWGTNGDCQLAIDLRADGTSDGPFGNWTYTDGVIGFADEPDFKVEVTVIDDKTMESHNASGKTAQMTRCP